MAETDAALAAALAGSRVLVAYGLLGEVVAAMRPLGLDYMGAQVAWLRGLGVDCAVVPLPTAAPVAANAARLRAALLAAGPPAVVIGHSKGGLEALAALTDPEAAARCRALVAVQSPFAGSPVADALLGLPPVRQAAGAIVRAFRLGTGEGLQDLTLASRRAWMAAARGLAALTAEGRVTCVASVLAAPTAGPADRRYLPLARWVERRSGPNDGLVPVASALLPGARHLVVPGSHRGLVAAGPGRDPVALLRRALRIALA